MIDQMLVSIVLIIASLFAGLGFGLLKKRFSTKEKKAVSLAMTGMVFLLIFLMGVKTGINQEVMAGLGIFGVKALLLALGAIAGSLLFVVAFDRLFLRSASK
jgi:hypothetical protein